MELFLRVLELLVPVLVALVTVGLPLLFKRQQMIAEKRAREAEEETAQSHRKIIELANNNIALLAIEKEHCANNKLHLNASRRNAVRHEVRALEGKRLSNNCRPDLLEDEVESSQVRLQELEKQANERPTKWYSFKLA